MSKCFGVPEMIPGVDGVMGKVILRPRAIEDVRMARQLESVQQWHSLLLDNCL